MKNSIFYILPVVILILLMTSGLTSCQKEFLDKKPDQSILVPGTSSDFQALLDNSTIMNYATGMNLIASDDLNINADGLDQLDLPLEKNAYLWTKDIYGGVPVTPDWDTPYQQILYANVVLDGLQTIDGNNSQARQLKGSALFFRSYALYQLLQLFAKAYDPATAGSDPGVPMPLTSNVNERPGRGTVAKVYDRITGDLNTAAGLLTSTTGLPTRPNEAAAYALLARIYLNMQRYEQAAAAAENCLKINGRLLDYNTLNPSADAPLPAAVFGKNPEVIFYSTTSYTFYYLPETIVAPEIAASYQNNDLRKDIFLTAGGAGANFKGSYTGDIYAYGLFAGLATDEIYLIRAEAYARTSRLADSQKDLNLLLSNRYKRGTFNPVTINDPEQLLSLILDERRKELVGRGSRWADLRRLNQDSRFALTLKRNVGGTEYTLAPNALKYVFPIPDKEINLSGITQNPR